MRTAKSVRKGEKVRLGIVGGGWISQAALMPGVAHTENTVMTALVTGDPEKAQALAEQYDIAHTYAYEDFERLLADDVVDALYIATPNWRHREFAVPALERGIHVLLEKPMEVSEAACKEIEAAAKSSGAKLMIAYRLHFEPATLEGLRIVRDGELGDVRLFSSVFTQHVSADNHRANNGFWAGPVPDMGPYPINAARNVFEAEPLEVAAFGVRNPDSGFDFHDTVSVTLRFPEDRIAQFTVGYGTTGVDQYRIVGTKGHLEVSPGFAMQGPLVHRLTIGEGRAEKTKFQATDQFGGELRYFSECVITDREPEPDHTEGLADVRVIVAIEKALLTGVTQKIAPLTRTKRPSLDQVEKLRKVKEPTLVNASRPGD